MRLGWLTALLFAAAVAALLGLALEARVDERARLARERDDVAQLRRELFVAEDKLAEARSALEATKARAALLDQQLAVRGAEKDNDSQLIADLKAKLDAKSGDVSSEGHNISINFVDEILFPSGEAELSAGGKQALSKIGNVIKDAKEQQILVGGHTDDKPIHTERFASNWELSTARAVNVARYLVETVGVDPHRVVAAGFSQFHPRAANRAKNRRIELLLTPSVEAKR